MVHIGLTPHTQKEPTQPTQGVSLTQKHKRGSNRGHTTRSRARGAALHDLSTALQISPIEIRGAEGGENL